MASVQRSVEEIACASSEASRVDEFGADLTAYADERLGDDFIEYLARRLGADRTVACQALSEWLNHQSRSYRPGLCKAMPGCETPSSGAFSASLRGLR